MSHQDTTRQLTYSELMTLDGYDERLSYLIQNGRVFSKTFGAFRELNQSFYTSRSWRAIRRDVIVRDRGLDLGVPGYSIVGRVYVHHMNPLTPEELMDTPEIFLDPEYLITASFDTHQAIHYASIKGREVEMANRKPGDTTLW